MIIKPATDQSALKVLRAEEGEFIQKLVIVLERLKQPNQIFSTRHQVISSCVTVRKKGYILQDVGTISALLLASKQDIFNEMSSCVGGDKARYFTQDPGTFTCCVSGKNTGYFLANRTNSSHVRLLVRHRDIFQLCEWWENQMFLIRHNRISSMRSWDIFQSCLWYQNQVFLRRHQDYFYLLLRRQNTIFS